MLTTFSEHWRRTEDGRVLQLNAGHCMLEKALDADELGIFESGHFGQMLAFKWARYAYRLHIRGCFFHFVYVATLVLYVNEVYINANTENNKLYQYLLILGVLYPIFYETRQAYMGGVCAYLTEAQNYVDIVYIVASLTNVVLANTMSPFNFANKVLLVIIFLMQIIRTFNVLRIFDWLSYIVTMIY